MSTSHPSGGQFLPPRPYCQDCGAPCPRCATERRQREEAARLARVAEADARPVLHATGIGPTGSYGWTECPRHGRYPAPPLECPLCASDAPPHEARDARLRALGFEEPTADVAAAIAEGQRQAECAHYVGDGDGPPLAPEE